MTSNVQAAFTCGDSHKSSTVGGIPSLGQLFSCNPQVPQVVNFESLALPTVPPYDYWHELFCSQYAGDAERFDAFLRLRGAFSFSKPRSDFSTEERIRACECAAVGALRDLMWSPDYERCMSLYTVLVLHRNEAIDFVEGVVQDWSDTMSGRDYQAEQELHLAWVRCFKNTVGRIEGILPAVRSITVIFVGRLECATHARLSVPYPLDEVMALEESVSDDSGSDHELG